MHHSLKISSTEITELEAYLSDRRIAEVVKGLPGETAFGFDGTIASFGRLVFVWSRIIGNYEIRPTTAPDVCSFYFLERGISVFGLAEGSMKVEAGDSLACKPPRFIRAAHDSSYANVVVPNDMLQRRISILLDRPTTKNVEFVSGPLNCGGVIPALANFIREIENSSLLTIVDAIGDGSRSIADAIVDTILLSYPNNFSQRLHGSVSTIAPRHVKRALDFIRTNPRKHITPQQLAHHSGVSIRSLQYSFRAATGYTITEYQRNLRLRGAIDDLVARPELAINVIASEWGFPSVSMFGQLCRKAFGLTPSALRRSKK